MSITTAPPSAPTYTRTTIGSPPASSSTSSAAAPSSRIVPRLLPVSASVVRASATAGALFSWVLGKISPERPFASHTSASPERLISSFDFQILFQDSSQGYFSTPSGRLLFRLPQYPP